MKHISKFLPSVAEVRKMRERALIREEVRQRKYLTDMIAIHFADSTYSVVGSI